MLLGRSDGHEAIERPQTRNIVGIEDSQFINKCFLPSATWACSGWVHRTRLTAPSSTFRVTAHPSTLVGWGPGTKWSLNPKGCVQSKPHVIRAYSTYLIHNRPKTLFWLEITGRDAFSHTLNVTATVGSPIWNLGKLWIDWTIGVISGKGVRGHRCLWQVALGWVAAAQQTFAEKNPKMAKGKHFYLNNKTVFIFSATRGIVLEQRWAN